MIVRTVGTIDRWYVEVQENQIATTRHFCSEKKTKPAGGDRPHGITLRRRPSHASLENPRTPVPPIHSGPLPMRKAGPQLCFGHGTSEEIFFNAHNKLRHLRPEIQPREGSNPGRQGAERSTRPIGLALAGLMVA